MGQSTNTSYAVIVLGDRETAERGDLALTAAEQGAVITETYSFDPGEAAGSDDLAEVQAVIAALSRAIATRTDVWVPFPFPDFVREQHVRRISLVLQRHGLNMLMGQELEPCTIDGGFNPIDFALRAEVRAVDELDAAVVASAGATTLIAEIARALAEADHRGAPPVHAPAGRRAEPARPGEKFYGTGEVARLFGKSVQWLNWAMREGVFTHRDGSPIEPLRVGKNRRRRFSIPVLRAMARSGYRRGILSEDELLDLLAVLSCAEAE